MLGLETGLLPTVASPPCLWRRGLARPGGGMAGGRGVAVLAKAVHLQDASVRVGVLLNGEGGVVRWLVLEE
jgi:hypothetical protein